VASRSALLTVLFTDIVASTEIAKEMGDRRWRELLARHHRVVRRELKRFGGREVDTAGDGFFAVFDRPEDAVRCAAAISDAVRELGIEIRAGVHAGQVELTGRRVGGVAVHVGARIGAQAGPGEVLVSATLRDLLPGAVLAFEDRGSKDLKGVPEPQRVYAVAAVQGRPRAGALDEDEARRRRETVEHVEGLTPAARRRRRLQVGALASAIIAAAVVVWLTTRRTPPPPARANTVGTIVRIDPETNAAVERFAGLVSRDLGFSPPVVEAGEGGVWVLSGQSDVRHVDPSTGVVTPIEIGGRVYRIALGHGRLWATARDLVAVSPGSLAVDGEYDLEEPVAHRDFLVAVTDDAVWTASQGSLTRLDPVRGDQRTFDGGTAEDGMLAVGDDLWLVDRFRDEVSLFDTGANDHVQTIRLQSSPDHVAAGDDGTLWILDEFEQTVTPLSPDGDHGRAIPVGEDPLAVAAGDGAVWVGGSDNKVRRIDPALDEVVAVIDVGAPVRAIDIDPETGEVWVYLAAGSQTGGGFG